MKRLLAKALLAYSKTDVGYVNPYTIEECVDFLEEVLSEEEADILHVWAEDNLER